MATAADEIERLRKALADVAQRCNESGPPPLGERETIHAVHHIARAAIDQ